MSGAMCQDHPEEKLRFLCVPCDKLVCRDCKLTEHEGHRSTDLSKATAGLKEKLQFHRQRLQDRLSLLDKVSQEVDKDKQASQEAQKHLEAHILNRAAMLAAWVEESKQKALETLDVSALLVSTNLTSMTSDLDWRRQNIHDMVASVDSVVDSMDQPKDDGNGPAVDHAAVFDLEREMRTGRGKGENLERLTETLPNYSVLVTLVGELDSLTVDTVSSFLGTSVYTQISKTTPKVALSPLFRCEGAESDARLNALCPMPDGTVWVAHDVSGETTSTGDTRKNIAQRVALYTREGRVLRVEKLASDGVSIARVFDDWALLVGRQGAKRLLSRLESREAIVEKDEGSMDRRLKERKNRSLDYVDVALSKLNTRFSAQSYRPSSKGETTADNNAMICSVEALPVPCAWVESKALFPVKTRFVLAMDVDSTGTLFAVLLPDLTVGLYRNSSSPDPVSTYRPGFENFSPADVCFHVLGGTEVLLVADWFNSAVHVLDVTNDVVHFRYYLGAGCPLLSQPTCLISDGDDRKRLLIGCRGGQVLLCCPADAASSDTKSSK